MINLLQAMVMQVDISLMRIPKVQRRQLFKKIHSYPEPYAAGFFTAMVPPELLCRVAWDGVLSWWQKSSCSV